MKRIYAGAAYASRFVRDDEAGFVGVELDQTQGTTTRCVARLVFWDATGQFAFETLGTDLPLVIVEALIAEAKAAVPTA